MKRVDEEYAPKLEAAKGDPEKFAAVKKEYSRDRHIAKHTKLITQIQMIFQDPIASLNPRMTVREIVSEGLVINGIKDKKYIEEKVYEILELVGWSASTRGVTRTSFRADSASVSVSRVPSS